MPYKKGPLKGQLLTSEIRKLVRLHNKLSKITIPPRSSRDDIIKIIENNGYKIDHENQKLTATRMNKDLTLKEAQETFPVKKRVKKEPPKPAEKPKPKKEDEVRPAKKPYPPIPKNIRGKRVNVVFGKPATKERIETGQINLGKLEAPKPKGKVKQAVAKIEEKEKSKKTVKKIKVQEKPKKVLNLDEPKKKPESKKPEPEPKKKEEIYFKKLKDKITLFIPNETIRDWYRSYLIDRNELYNETKKEIKEKTLDKNALDSFDRRTYNKMYKAIITNKKPSVDINNKYVDYLLVEMMNFAQPTDEGESFDFFRKLIKDIRTPLKKEEIKPKKAEPKKEEPKPKAEPKKAEPKKEEPKPKPDPFALLAPPSKKKIDPKEKEKRDWIDELQGDANELEQDVSYLVDTIRDHPKYSPMGKPFLSEAQIFKESYYKNFKAMEAEYKKLLERSKRFTSKEIDEDLLTIKERLPFIKDNIK